MTYLILISNHLTELLCNTVSLIGNDERFLIDTISCDKYCYNNVTEKQECCGFIRAASLGLHHKYGKDPEIIVERQGKNKISLRYKSRYLSVNSDGTAAFDSTTIDDGGILFVERISHDQIALKSIYNKYLSTKPLGCLLSTPSFTSTTLGSSEIWRFKCLAQNGK